VTLARAALDVAATMTAATMLAVALKGIGSVQLLK
jgi:hypothetical protein